MLRITALSRGGLAAYGPGHYDPKEDIVRLTAPGDDEIALSIEYPSVPSAIVTEASGLSITTPSVLGNVASAELSSLDVGGEVTILAQVGGVTRSVTIRTEGQGQTASDAGDATIPDLDAIFEAALT